MTSPAASQKWLQLATWVARAVLGGVFAWAALGKLRTPADFATAIGNYQLLVQPWTRMLAVGLPVFELVVAAGLLIPQVYRGSALLASALLWLFAGAMAQAKARGIDLACGCFGAEAEVTVSSVTILRNVALALLALWVALRVPAAKARASDKMPASSQ